MRPQRRSLALTGLSQRRVRVNELCVAKGICLQWLLTHVPVQEGFLCKKAPLCFNGNQQITLATGRACSLPTERKWGGRFRVSLPFPLLGHGCGGTTLKLFGYLKFFFFFTVALFVLWPGSHLDTHPVGCV